ncbi:LysR family transcriptional regulator [Burkholderia glumae]|uniref:LysR family transcriptional regulator n=1 Tax=Burkholderia glumae TaxID=337 RepID=A0AAP9XWE4_BURGL|nr:LysR family transcriptional regulator [Burkholderia glumae]ACR31729.1 Transcriptional regulator, LysR family [Burkholderia glumae BGR1]AJY64285.1 bacterial regulatory helix-turn-helix, lysR family protein [Burkholderia glumae LMG 2196 = ATCC 33617]KHJ61200.1 LysR family transcriptional regulator [Burkholderia glumae]MCM2485099.1 LysR family transcriptional regulator [Burkholderia glumae]MCM2510792.1 LysR family transcriptional regulator [Burkholderia glumae]
MLRAGLSELTAFVAIAEQRSFRAAARALAVSPSALSHAMRSLEARLGVRLFNRTTRSVALTEAGERLLHRVGPALSDLESAVDEVSTAQNRPSGSVRINAPETSARLLIRHVLPDFLLRYPDIHVEFVTDTRLIDIVAEGFDAGIRALDDVPRDMIAVRFGPDMRFIAVASPAYLARHPAPERPADLMQHRCIRHRFESGALLRWDFQLDGKTCSLDVNGPLTLGNPNAMIEAALAGIGVAWVPESQIEEHLASGRLIALLDAWSVPLPGLALYYPANRHPPAPLRLFTQAVRDWVAGGVR